MLWKNLTLIFSEYAYNEKLMLFTMFPWTTYVINIPVIFKLANHCISGLFFSIWVFFHEHLRFKGQQREGEAICLTSLYHFHPLHRHLDISQTITVGTSNWEHLVYQKGQSKNACFNFFFFFEVSQICVYHL